MRGSRQIVTVLTIVGIFANVVFAENETWTYCDASGDLPPGRYAHTAVFDEAHNRMVIFGGVITGGQRVGDMWALDGSTLTWSQLSANNQGPIALAFHTAIYDPIDTAMVLFCGATELDWDITNRVWILDLNTMLWEEVPPDYPAPNPRMCLYAVYGPGYHQMLIFAGRDFDYCFNDLWIFDLDSRTWQQVDYASTAPVLREGAQITIIDDGERLLINGGWNSCTDFYDDVWTFDFNTSIWTPYSLPAPFAPPRSYHSLIYDETNDRAMIFGGFNTYGGNGLYDLWELDLSTMTFSQISPAGNIPSNRGRHTIIFGGFSGHRATVFGGAHNFSQFHNDTYFLDWDVIVGLEDDTQTPKRASTLKCYPNPFNRQTEFVFAIEKSSQVRLSIYNTLGQKIQTVVRDNFNAGSHSVIWDAEAVPSGVYFARLETEFAPENVKMVLLK